MECLESLSLYIVINGFRICEFQASLISWVRPRSWPVCSDAIGQIPRKLADLRSSSFLGFLNGPSVVFSEFTLLRLTFLHQSSTIHGACCIHPDIGIPLGIVICCCFEGGSIGCLFDVKKCCPSNLLIQYYFLILVDKELFHRIYQTDKHAGFFAVISELKCFL